MPYSLKGRNVLVTGGSRGLGALLCERFAAEGCNIAINYLSSSEKAHQLAESLKKKYSIVVCLIQGDAGNAADNARMVKESHETLSGLDIIIANAGWTRFAKRGDIYDLSNDEWNKCWATNVMAHLQLMQEAAPIFSKNPEGGVYLITSSVAGITPSGSSIGYSVTKAAGLHLMKTLALTQGPKIRVNAVLPGLLLTEWGERYGEQAITAMKDASVLKHETFLDDCADAFIMLAKNNSTTGQQITVGTCVSFKYRGNWLILLWTPDSYLANFYDTQFMIG